MAVLPVELSQKMTVGSKKEGRDVIGIYYGQSREEREDNDSGTLAPIIGSNKKKLVSERNGLVGGFYKLVRKRQSHG